jgi:hypothetical protein
MATLRDLKPCIDDGHMAFRGLECVDKQDDGLYAYMGERHACPPFPSADTFQTFDDLLQEVEISPIETYQAFWGDAVEPDTTHLYKWDLVDDDELRDEVE